MRRKREQSRVMLPCYCPMSVRTRKNHCAWEHWCRGRRGGCKCRNECNGAPQNRCRYCGTTGTSFLAFKPAAHHDAGQYSLVILLRLQRLSTRSVLSLTGKQRLQHRQQRRKDGCVLSGQSCWFNLSICLSHLVLDLANERKRKCTATWLSASGDFAQSSFH